MGATPIVPYRNKTVAAKGLLKNGKTADRRDHRRLSNTIAIVECAGRDEHFVSQYFLYWLGVLLKIVHRIWLIKPDFPRHRDCYRPRSAESSWRSRESNSLRSRNPRRHRRPAPF